MYDKNQEITTVQEESLVVEESDNATSESTSESQIVVGSTSAEQKKILKIILIIACSIVLLALLVVGIIYGKQAMEAKALQERMMIVKNGIKGSWVASCETNTANGSTYEELYVTFRDNDEFSAAYVLVAYIPSLGVISDDPTTFSGKYRIEDNKIYLGNKDKGVTFRIDENSKKVTLYFYGQRMYAD